MCYYDKFPFNCGHETEKLNHPCHLRRRQIHGGRWCDVHIPWGVHLQPNDCDECRQEKKATYQAWAQPLYDQAGQQYRDEYPEGAPYRGHWHQWFAQWQVDFLPHRLAWFQQYDADAAQKRVLEAQAKAQEYQANLQLGQSLQDMQDEFRRKQAEEQKQKDEHPKKKGSKKK